MRHSAEGKIAAIVLASLLLAMGALGCAGVQGKAETSAPAASLVITPASGPPASSIVIRGCGFAPGEKIELIMVVDGVPTELGEKPMIKEANEVGAFKAMSGIPYLAKPGVYSVRATGDKGTAAVAPLEVEEKPKKKK